MGRKGRYPGTEAAAGKVRIYFRFRGQLVREPLGLPDTPANRAAGARLVAEIAEKIRLDAFDYAATFPQSRHLARFAIFRATAPTFRQRAEAWLDSIRHELAYATVEGYEKSLATHIYPKIGEKPITEITYSDLTAILAKPWGSRKTRNNTLIPIRRVFDVALIDGAVKENPAGRIKYVRLQRDPPDPFAFDELEAILARALADYGDAYRNYFEVGFFAGVRTSEHIALAWPDTNLRGRTVRIHHAQVRKRAKTNTKTYTTRDIELTARAAAALERQKAHTFLAGKHVFLNPFTGDAFIDDRPPRRVWTRILQREGIRYREPYQMRHTFASQALMAGANPLWVSRQMGHSSLEQTLRTYARWIDGADRSREVGKLDAVFGTSLEHPKGSTGAGGTAS